MTRNLLAITAMALSLASTSALAQTTGTTVTTTDMDRMPMEWEGSIADAFYSDPEMGIARDDAEMRANWQALSESDQNAVRTHCENFAALDLGAGTASTGQTTVPSTAQTDTATNLPPEGTESTGDTSTPSTAQTDTATNLPPAGTSSTGEITTPSTNQTGASTGTAVGTDADDMHHASMVRICEIAQSS